LSVNHKADPNFKYSEIMYTMYSMYFMHSMHLMHLMHPMHLIYHDDNITIFWRVMFQWNSRNRRETSSIIFQLDVILIMSWSMRIPFLSMIMIMSLENASIICIICIICITYITYITYITSLASITFITSITSCEFLMSFLI
jgi:hypothetical protein